MLDKSEEERYKDWLYESEKKIILPAKTIVLLASFGMLYFLNREFFFSPWCLYFFLFCLLFRPYFLGDRFYKKLFYRHYLKVSFTSFIWDALFLVIVICLTGGVRSPLTLVLYAMIIRGAVSYFSAKKLFFSGIATTFLCWMIGLFLIEKNFLFLQEPFFFPQIALFWILSLASTFTIATLAKEQKTLQKSEKSLRSIFDTIGDLLFIADSETKSIRRVNQTALEVLGYTREELCSMTVLDLHPVERREEIVEILQEITEGRRRFCSIPLLTKKGRLLPVETRVSLSYYEGRPAIIGISRDISERKKAEESLKESEARYRALFEASADGIFIADSETRKFKYANLAFCKMLDYSEEELKGMGIDDIHPKKDSLLRMVSKLAAREGRKKTSVLDIPCLKKDGTIIYADINITTTLVAGRKCYIGIVREITERKKTEEVLRASEQRSRAIFDGVTDGVLLVDIETKKFYLANKRFYQMLGYSQEESKKLGVMDIYPKEDLPYVMEQFEKQTRGEITLAKDIPVKRKDGSIFYADVNSAPIMLAKKIYLISIFRDVTKRKQAEEELRRVNRALKAISGCNQAVIRATNESDLLHETCQNIVEIGGYRLAWVGFAEHDEFKTVRPVAQAGFDEGYLKSVNITWADTERGRGPTGTAIRTNKPSIAKNILTDPHYAPWCDEATKRGYASSISLPLIAEGQTIGALNIYAAEPDIFDVEEVKLLTELSNDVAYGIMTLRTRAERERVEGTLQESEERYRDLIESAHDMIQSVRPDGSFAFVNRAWLETLRYSEDEVPNLNLFDIIHPDSLQHCQEAFSKIVAGQRVTDIRATFVTKDGKPVFVEGNISACLLGGKLVATHAIFRDITERKKLQEQLIQSAKMVSLGLLAAGVSHEIRNPLSIIIQGIEYLKSSISPDALLLDSIARIKKAALRADKIVNDLLDFSRQRPPEWKELDISPIIEDTLSLIEHQINLKNIKIIRQFASRLPKVEIDSDQISQVFLDILLNAVDAMPKGGTITISLKQIKTQFRENYLQIAFIDTGCGIPKDEIQKVFDPFFSTKKKEGGVGLGLSVTRGIVEGHKGTIRIKSRVGKGTRVIISLPLV